MARDSILEGWFAERRFVFGYEPKIRLKEIVIDPEAERNIRLNNPLNMERVHQYAIAYQSGAQFPPLVVYRRQAGYGMLGGMHRYRALDSLKRPEIDCYVVDVKPDDIVQINVIRRLLNLLNGEPLSREEWLQQAVLLVQDGYSPVDAARLTNLEPDLLYRKLRLLEADKRLRRAGINPDTLNMPEGFRRELGKIQRDAHFIDAIKLASEARMTADQTKELVAAVNSATSDVAATATLKKWRQDFAHEIQESVAGKVRPAASPVRSLFTRVQQFERNLLKVGTNFRALPVAELTKMRQYLYRMRQLVDTMLKQVTAALETKQKAR